MKIAPSYPPLGVLYLAAELQKSGVEAKILDIDADRLNPEKILSLIGEFKPELVGITSVTPTINEAFYIADMVKKNFDIPIVLGGIHPTMNPQECMARFSVDFVVKGEGEETLRELVSELKKGGINFGGIKGLYYKKDAKICFGGERGLITDLDSISFPARRLLSNIANYRPPDAEHMPVASIMTTRGCPSRCSYCCTKYLFKDKYRMRGIDNVLKEIDELVEKFGIKEIHIADDAFNVNRKRTLELCEAIRRKRYKVNFEFLNGLKANMIDTELLDAFREIGIKNVGFGLESADRDILKNVKKDIMPEMVEKAVRMAKQKGFKTWLFFMIGLPGETKLTIAKSMEFAQKLDPDFAKFLIFKPFPGSQISNEMKEKGLMDDFNFDNYGVYTPPIHHLESMTGRDMLKEQKKAFREFYFRPKKIWSHIKRQKSIAQIKLSLKGFLFVCFNVFKKND